MVIFNTIDIYIYRYNDQLAISCMRGLVGRPREYCILVFFKLCVVSSNPVRDTYYCNY